MRRTTRDTGARSEFAWSRVGRVARVAPQVAWVERPAELVHRVARREAVATTVAVGAEMAAVAVG